MPGKPRSDGSLSEEDVLATTVRHEAELHAGDAQPMVVLNACQSARAGATLHGLGGFAEAFIEAGAGVFVGSSWSIGDAPAFAFVDALYENLVDGRQPLAAAAAAARRKARDEGDATWLAYVVYGHPRATVGRS
jgi:CHAT domain-containing protein